MLDTIIRNGTVVDGTGAPARHADVGIRDGRIVAVGQVDDKAIEEIDADGRIVSPASSTSTPIWTPRRSGTLP